MHKVGQSAHTAHGIGEIVEVDPGVRGSVSYKVAGRGFSVWVDAAKLHVANAPERGYLAGLEDTIDPGRPYKVNKDNSTTLPYDPTPQHHVDMFQGEQSIQPGDYEIDPDERLHSSDSLTGEQRKDNRPYPGPNPDLFAKSAGLTPEGYDPHGPTPEGWDEPLGEHGAQDHVNADAKRNQREIYRSMTDPMSGRMHHAEFEETDPERPEQGDDEWHEGLHDGPERTFEADYRPAGLSNRYAHIMEAEDHTEIGMFRRDPVGYQQRLAHVMIAGEEDSLIEKFADYTNLLDADEHMRTAAWKDVAAKAKRLRADGAVHPKDIGPNRIMAMVDGDNAQYQTLVLRGGDYAGIGKGANSATFSCTCSWGKWAFKRQFTFVGRMCSHALATLWELQSHSSKGNGGKFKSAAVTEDFKKWADDNNDGHIDQGCIQDFLNTQGDDFTREDVNKLYDYVSEHHQQAPERDYDIPYTLSNEEAYKTAGGPVAYDDHWTARHPSGETHGYGASQADAEEAGRRLDPHGEVGYTTHPPVNRHAEILRTRPMSLTPDLREVPKNDEHEWTDVTEDDRKTTGPDQIVHFSKIAEFLHRTADGGFWDTVGQGVGKGFNALQAPDQWVEDHVLDPAINAGAGLYNKSKGLDDKVFHGLDDVATGAYNAVTGQPSGGGSQPQPAKPAPAIDPGKGLSTDAQGNIHTPGGGGVTFPGAPALHPPAVDNAAAQHPVAPGTASGADGGAGGAGTPTPAGGPSAPGNPAPTPAAPGAAGPNAIGQGTTYHVNQGDTLSDIAARSGLGKDNYQQIADANHIADPNKIQTGQDIKIPGQSSPSSPGPHEMSNAPQPSGSPGPNEMGKADASTPPPAAPAGPPPVGASNLAGPAPVAKDPLKGNPGLANPALTPPVAGQPPAGPPPPPGTEHSGARRYAESSDASLLDKLRQKSVEPASDDLHHMDERNDEIRDLVDELNDRDMDASFMVASLHYADTPADGNPDFLGISSPGWADQPFSGSGPDPRHYISDSQSYLDDHEPDLHDVTDGDDIIKFNDDRSKPEQGPRHTSGIKPRGGPVRAPRIDPGVRGRRTQLKHAEGLMPEMEDTNSLGSMEEPDQMAPSINDNPGNDIVGNFQRSAAAQDLMGGGSSSGGGGMFSDDAIAANAQAMLKTAGRKFTQQEQRELEEEAHILGARNLPNNDDLAGTHYLMGI